jgi:hypothetical protein
MNRFLKFASRVRLAAACIGIAAFLIELAIAIEPSAAAPPAEFASFNSHCVAAPSGLPTSDVPVITVVLHNVPSGGGFPTGTVSMSSGTLSTSTYIGDSFPVTNVPGAFGFGDLNPPSWAAPGQPLSVSLTWTDGVGESGTQGPQLVGNPNCGVTSLGVYTAMAATQDGSGLWGTTTGGHVGYDGQGRNYGDMAYLPLNAPIVGMAATPDGQGYWLLGADGGVFSFGLAQFFGSTGGLDLDAAVVAMAATADGGGYYFVAKDGGVFAYGDAEFHGSMGGKPLNEPIVGMAVDQATGGYWLVASDGGVFSFDAPFYGSTGAFVLSQPVIGMEAAPDGSGYRLAARDGGIFSFDLPFAGSAVGGSGPMIGFAGEGSSGYWLLDVNGGVHSFGSAANFGPLQGPY